MCNPDTLPLSLVQRHTYTAGLKTLLEPIAFQSVCHDPKSPLSLPLPVSYGVSQLRQLMSVTSGTE